MTCLTGHWSRLNRDQIFFRSWLTGSQGEEGQWLSDYSRDRLGLRETSCPPTCRPAGSTSKWSPYADQREAARISLRGAQVRATCRSGLGAGPVSGPSLHAGAGLGEPRQSPSLAAGGARWGGNWDRRAGCASVPGARARSRGGRGGRSRAVSRRSSWRRRRRWRRRLAVGRRRGLRIVRCGIGSFWILYPVF